jgi:hypothetical protein
LILVEVLTLVSFNVFNNWFVIVDVVKDKSGLNKFNFLPITNIFGIEN